MSRKMNPVGQEGTLDIFKLDTAPFGTNTYIVICRESDEAVLIDAPGDADAVKEALDGKTVNYILMTHGHMDHVMALEELAESLGAPVAAHRGDAGGLPVKPKRLLEDGDSVECGKGRLDVIHTPGHTPGSLCFRVGKYLLAGDTIFPGGPGKTATPDDFEEIFASITDKVLALPDETIILPGHGNSSSLGTERRLIEAFRARRQKGRHCGDVLWAEE